MNVPIERSVPVPELRRAIERLLTEVEAQYGEIINFDNLSIGDQYWLLETDSIFDEDPPTINLGSLADDIETMQEIGSREDDEVFLWHDLDHVIGVLRGLSYIDHPSTKYGA